MHINANRQAEAIVSIPPNALVHVPGHGVTELWNALPLGGPSLLIRTVEHLTNVRVDHYLVVDFNKLAASLGPLGGVNVDVPALRRRQRHRLPSGDQPPHHRHRT